jgi:phage pi2 protein 07
MAQSIEQILDTPLADLLAPLIQAEVNRQLDEREQAVKSDYRCWWTTKDVVGRYGVTQPWIKAHITDVPKFQRQLEGFAFNYGGHIGWRFEPNAFSRFMRDHFGDIAREVSHVQNSSS